MAEHARVNNYHTAEGGPQGPISCFTILMPLARLILLALVLGSGILLPAQVTWRTDSLMTTWPVQHRLSELGPQAGRGVVRAVETQHLYEELMREASGIPVFADSMVILYTDLYGEPLRDHFRVVLGMCAVHFPMIEKELTRQGLPSDLKYLPMALSAMNVMAGSMNGRAGLWMLTYPVAMRYGLRVTATVDERHDPIRSTEVATRYLKDLWDRYQDRGLAIMAFACGPANVTRAQMRTGGAVDYRTLYPHFSEEEQEVLPLLMAFIHLSAQAGTLGLEPIHISPMEPADTVTTDRGQHLSTIAHLLQLPLARVQALNPTFCSDMVPSGQQFLLPRGMATRYAALRDSIPGAEAAMAQERNTGSVSTDGEWITVTVEKSIRYTVRRGDNLSAIAARHHVTVGQLKKWNGLGSDRINTGRKLLIKVKKRERVLNNEPEPELPNDEGSTDQVPGPDRYSTPLETAPGTDAFTTYTVRSGDSLYAIAGRYPGTSAQDLMEVNGITARIHPGQTIRIPRP